MFPIRPPEPELSNKDPFKGDVLGRDEIEPPLTQFVCQAQSPLVLAINGPWGTGKTTFLKKWHYALQNAGCVCLSFNAWATDFAPDPLIALVGELSTQISALSEPDSETNNFSKYLERIKKHARPIAARALPVLVRAMAAKVLELGEIEKEFVDLAGKVTEDQIAAYQSTNSEIQLFRVALQELVEALQEARQATEGEVDPSPKPVVILVDELDRCRPSYAVELLERMKHLFNVPNVVFVLGIDKAELEHAIKVLYGSDFNAAGYLRRFIEFTYDLPEAPPGNYQQHLFESMGINANFENRPRGDALQVMGGILRELFTSSGITLRHQEHVVRRLSIALRTIPLSDEVHYVSLPVLAFIFEWCPGALRFKEASQDLKKAFTDIPKPTPESGTHTYFWLRIEAAFIRLDQEIRRTQETPWFKEMQTESGNPAGRRERDLKEIHSELEWFNTRGNIGWDYRVSKKALRLAEQLR